MWNQIQFAPKDGTSIDIVAKHWESKTDVFILQRFANCWWSVKDSEWLNLEQNWCPVYWLPIPALPAAPVVAHVDPVSGV